MTTSMDHIISLYQNTGELSNLFTLCFGSNTGFLTNVFSNIVDAFYKSTLHCLVYSDFKYVQFYTQAQVFF